MALEITMPQLGESVTEGMINEWLVKVGDKVAKYQALCEVVTEKVNAEVPSTVDGIVKEILVPQGETVLVGQGICLLETAEGVLQSGPSDTEAEKQASEPIIDSGDQSKKHRYSPVVLHLAAEHDIDLSTVVGTGAGGRITRKDVLAQIEQSTTNMTKSEEDARTVAAPTEPAGEQQEEQAPTISPTPKSVSVDSIRRTIARRMVESKAEIPHAWTMMEADVTDLVGYRQQIKDGFYQREGVKLTFFPFFIHSVILALRKYPELNASWQQDGIIEYQEINISMAVATEKALFVPVIHDADRLSISGLAHAVQEKVNKARNGKLTTEDIQGGTFTVNNTGSFGSIASMPIINPPQSGIVTMEAIVKRPVVINNMIAIRSMVNLCFSFDHRLVDGLAAGRFLQAVTENLEQSWKGEGF